MKKYYKFGEMILALRKEYSDCKNILNQLNSCINVEDENANYYFSGFLSDNNLTQELLSKFSNVSRTKIARIENGSCSPSIKSLLSILGPIGYTIKIEKVRRRK